MAQYLNKDVLEASLCRESLYDFVRCMWDTVISEPPVWNWHIEYLCNELQTVAERVFKRQAKEYDLITNVPPGSTKSTIYSVMFPAWAWTRDRTFRSLCASYAFPLSLFLASQCRRVLTSEKYQRLFPQITLEKTGEGLMTNTDGGLRFATSVGGSVTGMHGHAIIVDDPLNPKEAVSETNLKAANDWFDYTLPSRVIDKAITPLIVVMQRLHQNDPTGHLLEQRDKIRHISIPAEITPYVRPRSLRKKYKDGLFDPKRLTQESLDASKKELGQYGYAGQYLQRPVPLGGGMFRVDQLKVFTHVPKVRYIVRYWDKAGTAGGGAYTVGSKLCLDRDGRFGIIDVVRGQWESAERERIIKQTAMMDGKGVIIAIEQEPGSGGKDSALATVKNLAGFRVRVDRPTGDKVLRADPFATQVNAGNVWILRGPWNIAYINEMQFFPFSRTKDQIDSSAGAFNQLARGVIRAGGMKRG